MICHKLLVGIWGVAYGRGWEIADKYLGYTNLPWKGFEKYFYNNRITYTLRSNPPGADRDLGVGQGRKRGGEWTQEMAADSGIRCSSQRRAAEAGGWRVWATYRWMVLRSGRGGEKRVLQRGVTTTNGC